MKSTKINFEKTPNLKTLFLDSIQPCLSQMKRYGVISETFFDSLGFPQDVDSEGNVWTLNGDSDIFARSKPLYSKVRREERKAQNLANLFRLESKREALLRDAQAALDDNKTCEAKLMALLQTPEGVEVHIALQGATLQMFQGLTTRFLTAFVRVRLFDDVTAAWRVPNKGTAATVNDKCKRTDGDLLIKLAFDLRTSKPKAKLPNLPPVAIPRRLIPAPSVVEFASTMKLERFVATEEWCRKVYSCVKSINHLGTDSLDQHLGSIDALNEKTQLMATKLLARLPSFLDRRIPASKPQLLPGRHWIWRSLCSKLMRVSAMMVLSNTVADELENRGSDESYLNLANHFQHAVGDLANLDGSYVVEDSRRNEICRAGAAEMGFRTRWEGHTQSSKLLDPKYKKSAFYNCYPHENVVENTLNRKGTFQSLNQLVGVGFQRSKASQVLALFEWDGYGLEELKKLQGCKNRNELVDKQYRHIVYLLEASHALAIEPRKNISSNPSCEWQLRFFGDD
jgi:hypothetical protein